MSTMDSDSEDPDAEKNAIIEYANENLREVHSLFLEEVDNGYSCKVCKRHYVRPARIIAHYGTHHYRRLLTIVMHDRLGLNDDDLMDLEDQDDNPLLAAAYRRNVAALSDITTSRREIRAPPIQDPKDHGIDDEEEDRPMNLSEKYPDLLDEEEDVPSGLDTTKILLENPWHPFSSGREFTLARWFIEANVGKTHMNSFFNYGLGPKGTFRSAHHFHKILKLMRANSVNGDSLSQWQDGLVNFPEGGVNHVHTYHYRNILPIIQSYFDEPWFRDKLVFLPEKKIRSDGVRVFTEMYTADWWWDLQVSTPWIPTHPQCLIKRTQVKIDKEIGPGNFVIPIIFGSDETHLTNYSGDKAVWPLYMSIGNIPSTHRNKQTTMSWELVALLPLPPKHAQTTAKKLEEAREAFGRSVQDAIRRILDPLKELYREGVQVATAEGTYKRGRPVVGAWLADYVEYLKLFALKLKACPVCEVQAKDLGECTATAAEEHRSYPERDSLMYQQAARHYMHAKIELKREAEGEVELDEETRNAITQKIIDSEAWFEDRAAKPQRSAVWELPHAEAKVIWKPDLLQTVYLGILKHLMEWIVDFLLENKRMDHFDWLWKNVPRYPGLASPTKAYREIKQWQGKEMRNAGRFVLAVLDAALFNPANQQERHDFASILNCTRTLIDFHLLSKQPLHDETSLNLMDSYLKEFHEVKAVFLKYRMGKRGKNAGTKAVSLYYLDLFDGKMPTAAQKKAMTASQKEERDELRKVAEMGACDFNLPKLHLISHFVGTIMGFGSLLGWSSEVTEALHKYLKEYYGASNKGASFLEQIVLKWTEERSFILRRLNLEAMLENDTLVFPEGWKEEVRRVLMVFESAQERRDQAKHNREYEEGDEDGPLPTPKVPLVPASVPKSSFVRAFSGIVNDTRGTTRPTQRLPHLEETYELPKLAEHTLNYLLSISNSYSIFRRDTDCFSSLRTSASMSVEVSNEDRFVFQEDSDLVGEVEGRKLARCTGPFRYRGEYRADAVYFLENGECVTPTAITQNRRTRDEGILSGTRVGILRCLFTLNVPPASDNALLHKALLEEWFIQSSGRRTSASSEQHLLAYIELLDTENTGDDESPSKLARVSRRVEPVFRLVSVNSIVRIAHLVPIPQDLWHNSRFSHRYIVNNRIDLATWYQFY